jgi:cyclic lactone autoinducer peptide
MRKSNVKKNVLKVVEKVISLEVEKNNSMWPPLCMGIYHQPKRPIKRG